MPRLPFFKFGSTGEVAEPPRLQTYIPLISLEGLQLGIDNLRHDVQLSPKFVEQARLQISRLITHYGNVDGILAVESDARRNDLFIGGKQTSKVRPKAEPSELKPLLTDIHVAALNRAKAEGNLVLDVLARVAILKFLRIELNLQFSQVLERCRMTLKNYDGLGPQKATEYRERVAGFQVAKKIILRQTGQELFRTLREIEKETLSRMRRSLFGNLREEEGKIFLNPLVFSEDGRDTYLNAEFYVMLGNFDRDPDRFTNVRELALRFLASLNLSEEGHDDVSLEGWLSVPENAQELIGSGSPDESTPEGRAQKSRLATWAELLEREGILPHVVASYEAVPLLAEYSPRINAHQLKNALISREERERVEKLIAEHGKLSSNSLSAAINKVTSSRGPERSKMAGRFLRDFICYHRDLRRLETLNSAMDSVNLIGNEKMRELSAMNGRLYDFMLAEEQRPTAEKVIGHVIIKADVRDSSRLTRSLLQRDMNPASYFSLNFYDPVNKLLAKYGASKVFLEGDAIILAMFEHEAEPPFAVSKACVLAKEMVEIVQGYNQLLERAGLPTLGLGVGISYQNSAPMYLLDGTQRIMISDALNESDRLSSCGKLVRKFFEKKDTPFNVYAFQSGSDDDAGENPDENSIKYNWNGIRISAAAFAKLREEISLEECELSLTEIWGDQEQVQFRSGLVAIDNGIFRKVIIRGSPVAEVNRRDFTFLRWTEQWFYEVCSSPAIYSKLASGAAAAQ